jgi:hypothetical protein
MAMTARQWFGKHMHKYTDYDKCRKACIKATKKDHSTVRKTLKSIWEGEIPERRCGPAVKPVDATTDDIIDKKDFLGSVDVVAQILKYLDTDVKDAYIENDKLRRKFGIGTDKWRDIVRLPVTEGRSISYNDRTGRRTTVWSSKKGIDAAKETISMARYDK